MFEEKLDLVDLIITALQEHEKRLDELYHRFEKAVEKLEKTLSS